MVAAEETDARGGRVMTVVCGVACMRMAINESRLNHVAELSEIIEEIVAENAPEEVLAALSGNATTLREARGLGIGLLEREKAYLAALLPRYHPFLQYVALYMVHPDAMRHGFRLNAYTIYVCQGHAWSLAGPDIDCSHI
eukprot:745956-Prorocentrum_minimum.AAC.2